MKRTYDRWTDQEDQMIRNHYPEYGAKIHEWLPGRTEKAVHRRAMRLGVSTTPGTKIRHKPIPYLDPMTRHWLTHDWGLRRDVVCGGGA